MMRRAAIALALAVAGAAAAGPAPLLQWADDPPATEVRPLSGARTVTVRYGALAPETFHAELDGEPVTALFAPAPNTVETVTLPFIGGRNHLKLGASGVGGLEHIAIERWVVFARLPSDADAAERLRSAPELKHELWKQQTPETPPKAAPPAATPTTATGGD